MGTYSASKLRTVVGLKLNYKNKIKLNNQQTINMAATITQISESIFTALEPHAEQVFEKFPQLRDAMESVQKKTGVQKEHVVVGVPATLIGLLLIYLFAPVMVHLIAVSYPMFMTVKAIETPERNEATRWLNYWVIFQFITIFEFVVGFFLAIIPGYYIVKLAFVVWCMAPIKNNGCEVFYRMGGRTLFLAFCAALESVFGAAQEKIQSVVEENKDLVKPIIDAAAEASVNMAMPNDTEDKKEN